MSSECSPLRFLPPGKKAAVCFSVDDIHPATSSDPYEAGGDLGRGALGRVERLLARHPSLRVTLFVTPDWRPNGLVRSRTLASRLPFLRDRVHWSSLHPPDRMRVDRHPEFVQYLNGLPRTELAMHGLHHCHPGERLAMEFQDQDEAQCAASLRAGLDILGLAGLRVAPGFAPPAWNLPSPLTRALAKLSFGFVASARDLNTPVSPEAVTNMSGLTGVSLLKPQWLLPGQLLHFTSNFQATSSPDRAFEILECGGVLSIKAHIFKTGGGHTMIDGLDDLYCNYLDLLFTSIERRYGDEVWWTSMGEIRAALEPRC